jgi:hypothetical protein
MPKQDPKLCSMMDCDKPLGPDALIFEHKGEPAGGICENCTSDEPAIRVLFELNADKIYEPVEMVPITKTL